MIGKTLFEADINGKISKIRSVPEKAAKNQLKMALVQMNRETKKLDLFHCLINF